MEHILLVHGMRHGNLNERLKDFVHNLMADSKITYTIAFLESNTENPINIIEAMIHNGHRQIKIIPLLIFSASHMLEDIPKIISYFNEKYKNVSIGVTPPLGTHLLMKSIIQKRLNDSSQIDSGIVIIAHGNKRFKEADDELTSLVKSIDFNIHPMMIYGELNYETLLPKIESHYKHLTIVPLFLYDGYLVNKVKQTIKEMNLSTPYTVTPSINFDPLLKDIIIERL